jgi:hypothetical protein
MLTPLSVTATVDGVPDMEYPVVGRVEVDTTMLKFVILMH